MHDLSLSEGPVEAAPVRHVLIVDDDAIIRRLLGVRLQRGGYAVAGVDSGEEALAYIEARPVDLVFLDVSLPGMSGLAVLAEIRRRALDAGVIMTTAFSTEETAIEALRLGADDYLRKPLQEAEFQAVLERTVARRELTRQNAALRARLAIELARAARVQADLLPSDAPILPGFDLAACCIPAREVGGDFYDWQEVAPGQVRLTLADVAGKGIPAALQMATVRAALRMVARELPPAEAIERAHATLLPEFDRMDSYVTLFHAHLDAPARLLTFVDAGHGHGFLRLADGSQAVLTPRCLPIGLPFEASYRAGALSLAQGDCLVLYSDGLLDAAPACALTPDRLAEAVTGATTAAGVVDRLLALPAVNGPPVDDLTVLVLRCTGDAEHA